MPPRKSTTSIVSNDGEEASETPKKAPREGTGIEDLSLPKSMIQRLAKGVLPPNTSIQKDALLALHKSATVFVNYIASNSNELAQSGGKKTIQPQDVMAAIKDAELEKFLPRLEAELQKYNAIQCDKRNTYRRKVKEEKAAVPASPADGASKDPSANGDDAGATSPSAELNGSAGEDRPAKKVKRENGTAEAPEPISVEDDEIDAEDEEQHQDDDEVEEDEGADEEGEDGDDADEHEAALEDAVETNADDMDDVDDRDDVRDEALDEVHSD